MKAAASASSRPIEAGESARPLANPATSDSRSHPVVSSINPAARISIPNSRRIRPSSIRIFAITGTAEIAIATPMKSAKMSRWSGAARYCAGSARPSIIPAPNGITIPHTDTQAAARPWPARISRSVSSPI